MSVRKEANGRRSVQVEVEVPGTQEQVWRAVASGPGISAWFAPTQVEEGKGGKIVTEMMPGMESTAVIKEWEPPHRLLAEDPGWMPGMPPVMTEWTVEARQGGTCLVRVVHSLFAATDEWDSQIEGTETGWPGYFRVLRIYLTDFCGQRCSMIRAMGMSGANAADAWSKFLSGLGANSPATGQRFSTSAGAPPLAGVIEQLKEAKGHHNLLVRLEQPGPGVAFLGSDACGGMVMATVTCYLYGDAATAVAKSNEPLWQEWMSKHFPADSAGGG